MQIIRTWSSPPCYRSQFLNRLRHEGRHSCKMNKRPPRMQNAACFGLNRRYVSFPGQVATDKVSGRLSSTLSWVKKSVSHTVGQMASQVAPPTSLPTSASSPSLSSPSPSSPPQLSPDDVQLLAKLEEQNRWGMKSSK